MGGDLDDAVVIVGGALAAKVTRGGRNVFVAFPENVLLCAVKVSGGWSNSGAA